MLQHSSTSCRLIVHLVRRQLDASLPAQHSTSQRRATQHEQRDLRPAQVWYVSLCSCCSTARGAQTTEQLVPTTPRACDVSLIFCACSPAVLFQWRNSITLKKDPLAKGWFKAQMTLPGLFAMLGSPLPLYEASVGHRALELFLSDDQCVILRGGLASLMGPTRANNSWRAESNLPREKLSGWRRRTFANARELEQKMGELQLAEDAGSTLGAYQELVRLRGIWSALQARGKGSLLACDVETYEFVSRPLALPSSILSIFALRSSTRALEAPPARY